MPNKGRNIAVRPLLSAVAGGLALAAANSGIALAAYGPTAGPVASDPGPGGYYCVVTSQTVGLGAGEIGPLQLSGGRASLRFDRQTFGGHDQVTLTEPFGRHGECQGGRNIGDAGFRDFRAVAGLGILVQHDGAAYHGRLAAPLRLRLDSRMIRADSLLVAWNGRRFVRVPGAVVRRGSVRAEVTAGADLALLSPSSGRSAANSTAVATASAASAGFLATAGLARAGAPEPGLGFLAAPHST
jgi:hypothetical protein